MAPSDGRAEPSDVPQLVPRPPALVRDGLARPPALLPSVTLATGVRVGKAQDATARHPQVLASSPALRVKRSKQTFLTRSLPPARQQAIL